MKTHGRLLALLAITASTLSAAPFVALGEGAELFLTANVTVTADDNIYLRNTNASSDTILDFAPGLDLVFGRKSATQGNVYFKEDIMRYMDNDIQNTTLTSVGFNSKHEDGKTKADFGASYVETATNEPSAPGQIVPKNTTSFRGLVEFGLSEKSTIATGVRWEKGDYATSAASFNDAKTLTIPVDYYLSTSPKLQTSVGYRYRSTDIARETASVVDSKDHFFNVGARGEFTPKLTGQLRVGYGKLNRDNGKDDSLFGIESSFTYAYSPKTSYQFGVTNDFGTSGLGESTKALGFNLGANNKLDDQWSWNANLSYRSTDYPSRSDDMLSGGVGVAYTYSNTLNFAAGYSYKKNSSDSAALEFKSNVFNLSANIRY